MFLFPFDMLSFMIVSVSLFFVLVCHSHHSYTPYPPPPRPQILNKHCLQFLIKNKGYGKFGGANRVYYGRCTNGEYNESLPREWKNRWVEEFQS